MHDISELNNSHKCKIDKGLKGNNSLRKHAYLNILKFLPSKNEKFQIKKKKKKNSYSFHISAQNIDCGYSLEPPRRECFEQK